MAVANQEMRSALSQVAAAAVIVNVGDFQHGLQGNDIILHAQLAELVENHKVHLTLMGLTSIQLAAEIFITVVFRRFKMRNFRKFLFINYLAASQMDL